MMLTWISIGLIGLGVLCFLVGLTLMFIWKVPNLINELSGRKAKRQIQHIKDVNVAVNKSTVELYSSFDVIIDNDKTRNSSSLGKMLNDPFSASNFPNVSVTENNSSREDNSETSIVDRTVSNIDNTKTEFIAEDVLVGDNTKTEFIDTVDNDSTDIISSEEVLGYVNDIDVGSTDFWKPSIKIIDEQTSLKI